MKSIVRVGLAVACTLSLASGALAQEGPQTPEKAAESAVQTRQGLFKLMAYNMAPLGAMARNRQPFDAAVAQKSAMRLQQLAPMITDLFETDTRQFKNIKTEAKEGIWASKADFNSKTQDLIKATEALVEAAKTGDKSATIKATGAVGKACGACHDAYRIQ